MEKEDNEVVINLTNINRMEKNMKKKFRGIISLCERVAASGNTSILLSA